MTDRAAPAGRATILEIWAVLHQQAPGGQAGPRECEHGGPHRVGTPPAKPHEAPEEQHSGYRDRREGPGHTRIIPYVALLDTRHR